MHQLKVKVANEWQEQVTGLDLEIEHGNELLYDRRTSPLSTHVRPGEGEARLWLLAAEAESNKTYCKEFFMS